MSPSIPIDFEEAAAVDTAMFDVEEIEKPKWELYNIKPSSFGITPRKAGPCHQLEQPQHAFTLQTPPSNAYHSDSG
jgi:hypothetical protein